MYKVLADFKDLRDGGYQYHEGDPYPREGVYATAERVAMLSAPTPQRGALIGEVMAVEIKAEPEPQEEEKIEPAEEEKSKKKKKAKE